jgi:hypothetical protein
MGVYYTIEYGILIFLVIVAFGHIAFTVHYYFL